MVLCLFAAPGPVCASDVEAPAPARVLEKRMLVLVNRDRAHHGRGPLEWDEGLSRVARQHSREMAGTGLFSHQSPRTGSPSDRVFAAGIQAQATGENIAKDSTVEDAQKRLMESPGHRGNILSTEFSHIGIGIEARGPTLFVTQVYRRAIPEVDPRELARATLDRINVARSQAERRELQDHPVLAEIAVQVAGEMNSAQRLLPQRALELVRERRLDYRQVKSHCFLDSSEVPVVTQPDVLERRLDSAGIGMSVNRTRAKGLGMLWICVVLADLSRR